MMVLVICGCGFTGIGMIFSGIGIHDFQNWARFLLIALCIITFATQIGDNEIILGKYRILFPKDWMEALGLIHKGICLFMLIYLSRIDTKFLFVKKT